jgi:signal transduction histidine kinase
MNHGSYGAKREDLISERMLADVRLILSLATVGVVLKLMSEINVHVLSVVISLSLLLIYSVAMRLIVQFWTGAVRVAALISSVLELGLITYLIKVTWYNPISPCYLWYVFYIVSLAVRYGAQYAIVGMAPSAVLYTAIALSASNPSAIVPGSIGNTGFLFVLAFLFGHMSERQHNTQKQVIVANELAIQLASLPSSREIIEYLLEQTRELMDLDKSWFIQYKSDDQSGDVVYVHGVDRDEVQDRKLLGRWYPERVLRVGRALVSNNLIKDASMSSESINRMGLKSLAAVPMFVRGTPVGVLYAANRPPRGFSRYDVELLELLAAQASPVIENSQLWERLKDAAAAEERLRIARDLHDNFLQTLAAIKLHLERSRILVDKDSTRAKESIGRIHEIATEGLTEVRMYLSELRLMGPEPAKLGQAISHSVAKVASRVKIAPHVEVDLPESGIPPQVSLASFQIVRELLNNVVKHSLAENVWLTAKVEDEQIYIEVRDDGEGFVVPANLTDLTMEGHLGLTGVQERVSGFDGTLNIESTPGEGTRVSIQLPLGE